MLDPEGERFVRLDVGIDGDRIAALVPSARRPGDDDVVVELDGRWLLPGLIDCHVHLTQPTDAPDPAAAASLGRRGRPVRRCGGSPDAGRRRDHRAGRRRVELRGDGGARGDRGRRISGPRLFLAGRLLSITTATIAYYPGMYEVADGVDEVRGRCAASSPAGPT